MSRNTARFELVRSDAPQQRHVRFKSSNGRIIFASETYAQRSRALNAIRVLMYALSVPEVNRPRVVEVDERGAS